MIRIGIIGCGGMGKMHSQAALACGTAQLIAGADELVDKAKEFAEKFSCAWEPSPAALLKRSDIDAVMICTPTPSHHTLALEALAAGKHVFLEKPMARTLAQAEEVWAAAKRSNRCCQIGHVLRFWPEYVFLKEVVRDGRWGKPVQMKFVRVCAQPTWTANNWYIDPALSGGAALDLHLHDTDMVHFLLGIPKRVLSQGVKDQTGWRSITTHYEYPNGPLVQAEGTWYHAEKFGFNMSYIAAFEKGVLDYNCSRSPSLLFYPNQGEAQEPKLPKPPATKPAEGINISDLGGYLLQDQYFFACVGAGKPPETATFEDGRNSLATVEAEIRSAESGQWVQL